MTFSERAAAYADAVIGGEIPACEYVRLACERFIRDLQRDDVYLSEDGDRRCRFLEQLPHVKGKWAARSERLVLSDYQVFVVVNVYGWRRAVDNRRRFREAYVEVPRKNGKTFLLCGLGLSHLTIDDEFGAEVYCGASTELQAWEVFRPARLIVQRDKEMREHYAIDVNAKSLVVEADGSRFQPVIGQPGDGASPSCAIADEYHEHKTDDQVSTFLTGMGSRDEPLMLYITTAGVDMGGPCYEKRADVISILKGTVDDDSVFGIIYTIDDDDEWDTIEAQQKANPNYGVSVDPVFLEGQLKQAKRSPTKQAAYKTKHLNLWVGSMSAWLNMLAFQACRKKDSRIEDHKGERCVIGLDLASKIDLASMAIVFRSDTEEKYSVFCKHYLPEETIADSERYQTFHANGWITATPGSAIDYSYIADDLREIKSEYQIDCVAYDPFQATQFSVERHAEGFPMVEIGQTYKHFSEPMKYLDAVILQRGIVFDMDPVLLWNAGNAVARYDRKDNIMIDKETRANKIDAVVALIMAMNRWLLHKPVRSIYEDQDLVVA